MSAARRLVAALQGRTDAQTRLRGRLWAWRRGGTRPSDAPVVLFAIPLVSKRRASDWDRVQENLATTLASFARQSDPGWRAVVCGQDRPDALPDGVEFLRATVGDKFYDKGDKRRQIIGHVARTLKADCYYMQFDADDILHPGFVAHVRGDNNGRGYVIDKGWFVHAGEGLAAPLFPPDRPFHSACGSSAAVYADFRSDRRDATLLYQHRSHTRTEEYCRWFGRTLDPVPFPAALYMVGHGENMIARRGKIDARLDRARTRAETDADVLQEIETTFGTSLHG